MRLPAFLATLLFSTLLLTAPVHARDGGFGPPVDATRLDELRGGYALPTGLSIAFGLERTVTVNGELVVAQRVQIPDLGRITTEQAQQLAALTQGRMVDLTATGVRVTPGVGGLVIQNALDNQRIQTSTDLHVSLNTLGLLQNLNFNSALTDAQLLGRP